MLFPTYTVHPFIHDGDMEDDVVDEMMWWMEGA